MCKCGCNTCETKIRGPLLTEGRVKKLISENLSYHIDNNISLMENVFRIGSDAHLSMIKEAKKLYSRGVLDLCEEDKGLMKTHIGEFDLYENEIVPLDLPMVSPKYNPLFEIGCVVDEMIENEDTIDEAASLDEMVDYDLVKELVESIGGNINMERFRKAVSITLLVSLMALASSGIMMIVLNSLEFQLQMHPVHKIFGVLLTIAGALHLYLNLRIQLKD